MIIPPNVRLSVCDPVAVEQQQPVAAAAATPKTIHQVNSRQEGPPLSLSSPSPSPVRELPVGRHAVADAVETASPWVVNIVSGSGMSAGKGHLPPPGSCVKSQVRPITSKRGGGGGGLYGVLLLYMLVDTNEPSVMRFRDGLYIPASVRVFSFARVVCP